MTDGYERFLLPPPSRGREFRFTAVSIWLFSRAPTDAGSAESPGAPGLSRHTLLIRMQHGERISSLVTVIGRGQRRHGPGLFEFPLPGETRLVEHTFPDAVPHLSRFGVDDQRAPAAEPEVRQRSELPV